ncbi:MAG TPA: hypothetical protein VEZ90_16875 [Blastocatellia bacterium]|nr:hypothetical protein [Blastocatellia bacterium]
MTPFLNQTARNALKPMAVGACAGVLSGYQGDGRTSIRRILGFGFLGSLIGFASGLAWETRDLNASIAANALKDIGRVRDEHWLRKHPIDYG